MGKAKKRVKITTKKAASKKTKASAKKKSGVKKISKSGLFSKLDPCLMLGASHGKSAHLLGLGPAPDTDQVSTESISKIGLGIRSLASSMSTKAANDYIKQDLIAVLVETGDRGKAEEKVKSLGGVATRLSANKLMARVPRSEIMSLAKLSSVGYVEASTKLKPTCDLAHESTGLVSSTGTVNVSETGRGVLVGIIDTGIDITHPAFQSGGSTRIVNYLDQEIGTEFSNTDIDNGSGSDDDNGHGTHVAGIAAGNGAGSPNGSWRGVATEADLAIVKTSFDSTDIAVAIKHIFDLADARNQPCVVNLSLGGHVGAHDGSSISERMIDDLSGDGRIVVVSAGNEGGDSIHASTVLRRGLNPADRWVADFRINSRSFNTASGPVEAGILRLQVWHQREDAVTISLRSPLGNLFTAPLNNRQETDLGNIFVEASHQQHPYSLDHSTTFFIVTNATAALLNGWSIIAEDDQPGGGLQVGSVHAWIQDSDMGVFTTGATNSHLVGMPGTSFSAITVGSYASRNEWPSRTPNAPGGIFQASAINPGDISHFSSPGPTRDGHNKPEIAGPGQLLLAPLSKDAPVSEIPNFLRVPNHPYAALQGTSMSAPYVTGSIALLLEKEGNLNWSEIKRRLMKSSVQDRFTQTCWNPRWGYGKLQVDRLLEIEPAS